MITVDLWAAGFFAGLVLIVGALGLGFGFLSGAEQRRAEAREQALRDQLQEQGCELAVAKDDLIEAARKVRRAAIARRNTAEWLKASQDEAAGLRAQLASCRCAWPADEPTLDLGPNGIAAQVEEYLAQQAKEEP